jgi:hypothetical protein
MLIVGLFAAVPGTAPELRDAPDLAGRRLAGGVGPEVPAG